MTTISNTNKEGPLYKILFILLAALFYLLPLVFSPVSNDFFKLPKFALFHIFSFSALALCMINALLNKKFFSIFTVAQTALLLFLIYIIACLVSLFYAKNMTVAIKDFLPIISVFTLFAVLSTQNMGMLNHLVTPALFSVMLCALIGIFQHFGADITGLSAISGVPASFMASTLGHRNYLAELLCIAMPFGFGSYYNIVILKPSPAKPFVFTTVCLMFFALLLTNSRSGWLSFAISTLFFCSS